MTINKQALREKFEAWAEEAGALPWGHLKKQRTASGNYSIQIYTYMWKAWSACHEALAAELEAAEKRIAELESEVKFPGVMHCNSCGFSRSHVIVTPGGMRAGESTPEHCPNGCGPMWHDTYRRQYNELYDAYKALESRTVTVKLPAEYLNADGSVNADMANTCPVVSAYREAHRAAGIQVIEGEGQ